MNADTNVEEDANVVEEDAKGITHVEEKEVDLKASIKAVVKAAVKAVAGLRHEEKAEDKVDVTPGMHEEKAEDLLKADVRAAIMDSNEVVRDTDGSDVALGGAMSIKEMKHEQERARLAETEATAKSRVEKFVARVAKGPTFSNINALKDWSSLEAQVSPKCFEMVKRAFEGLENAELVDYHTHVLGTGKCCDTGCMVPEAENVIKGSFMRILEADSGVKHPEKADAEFLDQLLRLCFVEKHVILAFDAHYRADGTKDLSKTGMYVPNDYVFDLVKEHPNNFLPSCSVHPYRKDAIEELERCHAAGARLIKWLPNSMGIDPSSDLCEPYYRKVAELGMIILSHCGEEKAVAADKEFQLMGNPLLFRRALKAGCKIIIAHCASLGTLPDLDDPKKPNVKCFDLFLRLAREYRTQVFGDISAITLINRFRTFAPLLKASDIHGQLINGTDYPLCCVKLLNRTKPFVDLKLITADEGKLLRELFTRNPILWDFCVKRLMRGPDGEKFPDSVFIRNKSLGV